MKLIDNKKFPNERDLYGASDIYLYKCIFDGIEDGESALKESKNIDIEDCDFNLRYPLWHSKNVRINNSRFSNTSRAPMWYCSNLRMVNSILEGVKAVRESKKIRIYNSNIVSIEFGWKNNDLKLRKCNIEGEYLFLNSNKVVLKDCTLKGKYSFQYVNDLKINDCILDTKDAFWHASNVVVKNSIVKGEYLGWYSDNLTLINCKIIGTQPLCYCTNLKLENCVMIDCDLAFEYSSVDAKIKGSIDSIKNPKEGIIIVDEVKELLITTDSKYKCKCKIIQKKIKAL